MALSLGRAPSSLTSPGTSARRCKYKVFLSFRGEDTRKGFVSHLYYGLELQGISTFMDDRELEGGAPISTELPRAIEDSCLAIIVFSPNYASSSWCLDELTKIVQCMDSNGSILPIFYDVDPSDVRKQSGSFENAFKTHDEKFTSTQDKEKVKQWKANLEKVAGRTGWTLKESKNERELIAKVVHRVWKKVQPTLKLFDSPDKFVGRVSALHQLSELLALGENDVRFIGITGMGGIGKTTLARMVFGSISHHFDFNCFLEKVREVSAKNHTVVGLQNQLLSSIFNEKVEKVWDEQGGANFIKNCLLNKKVLLILDDVDLLKQLQNLAGGKDWFGNGSRIIITTRNHRLLEEHDISLSYTVEGISDDEALELFSLKAFKKDRPDEQFLELSKHFIRYAKGVPLVLQILGSHLYRRDRDAWNSVLVNLQNNPHPQVFDLLKISYDSLLAMEKRIFLDIACFHKGKYKEQVIDILDRRFGNISSLIVIDTLIERSLLNKSDHMHLEMHDLIQDMGQKIVDRESEEEPGKRTRIWRLDDLRYILAANTGTEKVEAIVVHSAKLEEIRCNSKAISKMYGLRLIELGNNVRIISSGPICLPHSLRIIHWNLYPSKFLPQDFHPHFLTELSMGQNKLVRLWDGRKDFSKLKIMNLGLSDKLTSTPDFTGMPNLEELEFFGCSNLVDIHSSIAFLKRLNVLDFSGCKSIECLPSKFGMDSLEKLQLSYCKKLKKVPQFSEQMKTLSELELCGTAIEQLPSSVGNLVGLTSLDMSGSQVVRLWNGRKDFPNLKNMNLSDCDKLTSLPDFRDIPNLESLTVDGCKNLGHIDHSIAVLKRLKTLFAFGCSKVKKLPEFSEQMKSLYWLKLWGTAIEQLPSSIGNLVGLKELNLNETAIEQLPSSIGNLVGLTYLYLRRTAIEQLPPSIANLVNLTYLDLCGSAIKQLPSSIGNLVGLTSLKLSGCKRLCVVGLPVNRLRLEILDLSDCNLGEGAIPEDIGCLFSLKYLHLCGNHFVTLPSSIQCLSNLDYLALERCEWLQELPPLPPSRRSPYSFLYVNVKNCTSLQRLTGPSKLSSEIPNLYDFNCYPLNCMRLVEDEGWINYVLSKIVRLITTGDMRDWIEKYYRGMHDFEYPGSEIPEWFVDKSEEAGDWLGIAFCVVLATNPADYDFSGVSVRFKSSSRFWTSHWVYPRGHLGPEFVAIFYRSREREPEECPEATEAEFSFETTYYYGARDDFKVGVNLVKWAARWVYEQDLEDLQQRLEYIEVEALLSLMTKNQTA